MTEKYIVGRLFDNPMCMDGIDQATQLRDRLNRDQWPQDDINLYQLFRVTLVDTPSATPITRKDAATQFLIRVGVLTPDGGLSPNYYTEDEIQEHMHSKGENDNN